MARRLADMTWMQVGEHLSDVNRRAIIVIGATEQHGPIGKLDTDAKIATWAAEVISDEFDALIALTMPVGMSLHHTHFAGTISFSETTFMAVITEMVESLIRGGFDQILMVNGHGGNTRPLSHVVESLNRRTPLGVKIHDDVLIPCFYQKDGALGKALHKHGDGVSHACAAEMSMYYAMTGQPMPDTSIIDEGIVTLGKHGQGTAGADPAKFKALFPSGSKGDQRLATVEQGQIILTELRAELIKSVREFWE